MKFPTRELDGVRTHRLIPSNHSAPVLDDLFDDEDEKNAVFDLDGATNDRLLAADDRHFGINRDELVFRVPNAHIINAAFTHPSPYGGRFNTLERGAWYSSFAIETAIKEVAWHHTQWLLETRKLYDCVTKDEWNATFFGAFHDLKADNELYSDCLSPNIEKGYPAGQQLAAELMQNDGYGIIYPSVRDPEGSNLACFRPAMVNNVQKGATVQMIWDGSEEPEIRL